MHLHQIKNKKILLVLILFVLVLGTAVSGTLAMYTSQAHQRSVVRNRDSSSVRFYSDVLYLVPSSNEEYGRKFSVQETSEETYDIEINIYNYEWDKPKLLNENDIRYDITFTLLEGNWCKIGSRELTAAGQEYTISDELMQASKSEQKTYRITCRTANIDSTTIQVVAKPREDSAATVQNMQLAAIIVPIRSEGGQVSALTAEFVDKDRKAEDGSNTAPADYAAWPYRLSISTGDETVKLTWNPEILQVDPFVDNGNSGELLLPMSTERGTSSMLIPFYTMNKEITDQLTWDQLGSLVTAEIKLGD